MTPDPTMYIFLNRGLGMSTGKAAAQAAHAAVEAIKATDHDSNLYRLWYRGGHYKKIVLLGRDEVHMWNNQAYLEARGFNPQFIIDEGHTEVPDHVITAIGVPLVDKSDPHTKASFESFDLYKDAPAERSRRKWLL